jgi:hypothetical protein
MRRAIRARVARISSALGGAGLGVAVGDAEGTAVAEGGGLDGVGDPRSAALNGGTPATAAATRVSVATRTPAAASAPNGGQRGDRPPAAST